MGSVNGEDSIPWDLQSSSAQPEEKIFVSVRLRPMNEREKSRNDVMDWECINDTTIIYKNIVNERLMVPAGYTFDRVFGIDSSTRQVYDEAAKNIAFSVLNGINASIFAYGQTSSGKTYTMSGITNYTIADIYDYINKHADREYVLKFSAMEIYNECVRDLLSSDNMPLRLLDDPERGTVVEKLSEVVLRDWNHLKELLAICVAQRQIGETSLNEMSSRSHQILRLTVESSVRRYVGSQNSSTLSATVSFVDLAGSERASQTLAVGTRQKEGSHINRSLLTLGTVIRKLSKGRNGHVPFRDSKLTRILQNSLGGNARTAIICTVSPAHSHVEQSRNTLLFASCAKNVSTNAQVNVVMSEKALVKQLQKELQRLENELRILGSSNRSGESIAVLKEKEVLIEKMDQEIRDLTRERDLAQSRLQNLIQAGGDISHSRSWTDMSSLSGKGPWLDEYPASEASDRHHRSISNLSGFSDRFEVLEPHKEIETEDQFLNDDTSPTEFIDKYFGPDPTNGWEKIPDPADPADLADQADQTDKNVQEEISIEVQSIEPREIENVSVITDENEDEKVPEDSPSSSDMETPDMSRSKSCTDLMIEKVLEEEDEKVPEEIPEEPKVMPVDMMVKVSVDNKPEEKEEKIEVEEAVPEILKPVEDDEVPVHNAVKKVENAQLSVSNWTKEFEQKRREIIHHWDACNTALVHRTYFFLLFRGEPSDSIYMEVELRRLSYLRSTLSRGTCVDISTRALKRERRMLANQILKKFSFKEREALYVQWGVDLKTKQRRAQLCRLLWTDTKDMDHIKESSMLIAKLVGIVEPNHAPKEIFGLSLPLNTNIRSYSWKPSLPMSY